MRSSSPPSTVTEFGSRSAAQPFDTLDFGLQGKDACNVIPGAAAESFLIVICAAEGLSAAAH